MITRTQQLKQCMAGSQKLRSWLELAHMDDKQINFLNDLEKAVGKLIEKENA